MSDATAKLFMHGRSQAVRLPKAFRMPGREVRVRRVGAGVLLEPVLADAADWLAAIDAIEATLPPREQPPMPAPEAPDFAD